MNDMKKVRWGILGTAGIARKNWRALRDSGNSVITAVASRDTARADSFIEGCQAAQPFETIPTALGSYDELLASPDVDAVYIPLPTGVRKEWVLRAAAARKHVVCEKPCALSAGDLEEMIAACDRNGVNFMDGVMFMHNPRLSQVRQWLDDERSVGDVKRIMSIFSFRAVEDFFRDNIRIHSALEPTGCLGDLGWYCVRFSLWAMNWRLPRAVSGRILSQRGSSISPGPAPTDFSGELIFDDDCSAGFFCSFLAEKQQWVNVSGKKGALRIDDFVHPESDGEPVVHLNRETICVRAEDPPLAQDARMFRNFSAEIQAGTVNREWPMWALLTQRVVDACHASACADGRLFPLT